MWLLPNPNQLVSVLTPKQRVSTALSQDTSEKMITWNDVFLYDIYLPMNHVDTYFLVEFSQSLGQF